MGSKKREVTEIRRVKGSRDRLDVILDTDEKIRARSEVIARLGMRTGQVLDQPELNRLRQEAELAEAKEASLRLLSDRARTTADLRRRLQSRRFSSQAIDATIRMLEEQGLLDDVAYAETFVRERLATRPMGTERMAWELRQRGVDEEVVRQVVNTHLDPATESQAALKAARQRLERLRNLDEDAARHKVRAFLARRGFDEDVIEDVVNQACGLPGGA